MGWAATVCLSEATSTHGSEACAGHIWWPPVLPATVTHTQHTSLISKTYPKPTEVKAHTSALSVCQRKRCMEQGTIQDFQRKAVLLNNLLREALSVGVLTSQHKPKTLELNLISPLQNAVARDQPPAGHLKIMLYICVTWHLSSKPNFFSPDVLCYYSLNFL